MLPFDPDLLIVFPGIIVFTALIISFKLKKKELEVREKELEMRGGDPELGPVVDALRDDADDTRAQLADMQERLDFAERVLIPPSRPITPPGPRCRGSPEPGHTRGTVRRRSLLGESGKSTKAPS